MEKISLFRTIASAVVNHKEGRLSDLDLYNTIIKIFSWYSNQDDELQKVKRVNNWLDLEEMAKKDFTKQYERKNVIENAGEDYASGIELMARSSK